MRLIFFATWLLFLAPLQLAAEENLYSNQSQSDLEGIFFDRVITDGNLNIETMNQLVWEDFFNPLLQKSFSCHNSNATGNIESGWLLNDDVMAVLGGPSDALKLLNNRYIIGAASRSRSASEKGIIIADTKNQQLIFAMLNYFKWDEPNAEYDKNGLISILSAQDTDPEFLQASEAIVKDWINPFVGKEYYFDQMPTITSYIINCPPQEAEFDYSTYSIKKLTDVFYDQLLLDGMLRHEYLYEFYSKDFFRELIDKTYNCHDASIVRHQSI